MSTEDGRSPELFSHNALPSEPSTEAETGAGDFRPVFSRSDGSGPGSYPKQEQAN